MVGLRRLWLSCEGCGWVGEVVVRLEKLWRCWGGCGLVFLVMMKVVGVVMLKVEIMKTV